MNEREVECSMCDNTSLAIQEDIQSGWTYIEPGWGAIKGTIFCPRCRERYLKHRSVLAERARMYPNLVMHPSE